MDLSRVVNSTSCPVSSAHPSLSTTDQCNGVRTDFQSDIPHPPSKRSRPSPPSSARPEGKESGGNSKGDVIAAASNASAESPYTDLQKSVQTALESKENVLTTSDKVALALEVLRARQLELDLAQARKNIEALVSREGSAPKTLRSVIPASMIKGLPVGAPIDITKGKFLLAPTPNDPEAFFLTLDLQGFGNGAQDKTEDGGGMPVQGTSGVTTASIQTGEGVVAHASQGR